MDVRSAQTARTGARAAGALAANRDAQATCRGGKRGRE
jgi:hypothetical protein